MQAKCCQCKLLEHATFLGGLVGRVENIGYRCSAGNFDHTDKADGEKVPQYYAWGGIVRPNKTVAAAQLKCRKFQDGGKPR